MMQKKKSSPWAQAKFALAVPVAALSMVLFATQTATALSSEIAGCKVSNLFSGNQENPELIAENTTPQAEVKKQEAPDEPFTVVEKMPEYPGGGAAMMKFIADNLKYPKECADEKIDGRVVLSFIVEKDGSVSTVEEMKSPDARLTVEAIRVISSMPKWTPGQQRGENVRVKFVIPVTFALNSDKAPTVIEVKESSNANIGITGDNKPCIVIDGKVVPYEELRNTPSDKVESINVYKDEATKQKYLSKSPDAKNGVIVVTLKK